MKTPIRLVIVSLLLLIGTNGIAQEQNRTLGKVIDDLTFGWDLESDNLDDYDGMLKFCRDKEYRYEVIGMLKDIHHYDSVLLQKLSEAALFSKDKELKKTLKDISKFEEEYSMKEFIDFLFDECQGINELEKNRDDLEDEIAQESYDGRRYVLETEIAKYIHHITKRVDMIRDHVHHLHIK